MSHIDHTDHADLELLLGHAGWLRALAGQLVGDGAVADDLVQETWLRTLRRPPRAGVAVRAWLARVLSNTAASAVRQEQRQRRREHAAARADWVDPAPSLLQRAELQAALAAAVRALPEHERAVVVLRHYDELPPKQVAERLALPEGTVRKRLQRAYQRLRLSLQRRAGPSWRGVVAVALGLRPGTDGPAPGLAELGAAATPRALTMGAIMTSNAIKTGLGIGVGGLLLLGWWTARATPGDLPLPPAEIAEAPHLVGGSPPRDATERTPADTRTTIDEPVRVERSHDLPPGRAGWTGRVVHADGRPAPEASVLVSSGAFATVLATDAEGRFAWTKRSGRRWRGSSFAGVLAGHLGEWRSAPADRPPRELVLPLAPATEVTLRVVDDATGAPVAGVPLQLTLAGAVSTARSDSDGLARLSARGEGIARLTVRDWGPVLGMDLQREVRGGALVDAEIRVRLYPRTARLRAVEHRTGRPVAGVQWTRAIAPDGPGDPGDGPYLRGAWPKLPLSADARGVVTVRLPDDEHGIYVRAAAPGYFAAAVTVLSEQPTVIDVPLRPVHRTEVQVVAAGEPLAGVARIHWRAPAVFEPLPRAARSAAHRPRWPGVEQSGVVQTDASGRATLPVPAEAAVPEVFELEVEAADGRRRSYGQLQGAHMPPPPWLLDVAPPRAEIAVRVVDDAGLPVAGAEVVLTPWVQRSADGYQDRVRAGAAAGALDEVTGARHVERTDDDGMVRARVYAPSELAVEVRRGDPTTRATRTMVAGESATMEVRLQAPPDPGLAIHGRAVPRHGRWQPGRVRLEARALDLPADADWRQRQPVRARVADDGSFAISGLAPGRYQLHSPWSAAQDDVIATAGDRGVQVVVPPVVDLRVTVVDAHTGRRLPGALVDVQCGDPRQWWTLSSAAPGARTNDGVVFAPRWAADFTAVRARAPGYSASTVSLTAASPTELGGVVVALVPE